MWPNMFCHLCTPKVVHWLAGTQWMMKVGVYGLSTSTTHYRRKVLQVDKEKKHMNFPLPKSKVCVDEYLD